MAALFLVLAVLVGVVLGATVLDNTGPGSVSVFDQSITGFTHGQLLLIYAGLGFLFATFLFLAWGASRGRRDRRKERRLVHRDLEGRIDELERENASLREEVDRSRRTNRLGDYREGQQAAGAGPVTPTYSSREEVPRSQGARPGPGSAFRDAGPDQTPRMG